VPGSLEITTNCSLPWSDGSVPLYIQKTVARPSLLNPMRAWVAPWASTSRNSLPTSAFPAGALAAVFAASACVLALLALRFARALARGYGTSPANNASP